MPGSPLPKGMDAPEQVNESKMIDVNTASLEEIEALPSFIREKMQSSDEFKGRIAHAENMRGPLRQSRPGSVGGSGGVGEVDARPQRPDRVAAEMEADEQFAADTEVVPDEPAS